MYLYSIRKCISFTSDNVSVLHQTMCQYYIRKCISFTLVLQRLRPPHTDQNNLCYNKHELAFGDNQTIVTMQLLRYVDNYVRRYVGRSQWKATLNFQRRAHFREYFYTCWCRPSLKRFVWSWKGSTWKNVFDRKRNKLLKAKIHVDTRMTYPWPMM